MDITFLDEPIRDLCEKEEVAFKILGQSLAEKLQATLANILSVDNLKEVPVGNIGPNPENLSQYILSLDDEHELRLRSAQVIHQEIDNTEMNWEMVSRIQIIEIKAV